MEMVRDPDASVPCEFITKNTRIYMHKHFNLSKSDE